MTTKTNTREVSVSKVYNSGYLSTNITKNSIKTYAKYDGKQFVTNTGEKYNPFCYYKEMTFNIGDIYEGYVVKNVVLNFNYLKEITYNGKVVTKEYRRPAILLDNGITTFYGKTEDDKRNIKYQYTIDKHPMTFFYVTSSSPIELVLVETPLKEVYSKNLSIRHSGGGYGEKYYVNSVDCYNINEKLYEIINNVFRGHTTESFKNYIRYYGYNDKDAFDWSKASPDSYIPEWAKYIFETEAWSCEVEYEQYEGYIVRDYKFKSYYLQYINDGIMKIANEYTDRKIKTFEQL